MLKLVDVLTLDFRFIDPLKVIYNSKNCYNSNRFLHQEAEKGYSVIYEFIFAFHYPTLQLHVVVTNIKILHESL